MMGEKAGQSNFPYNISLEQFVPVDHPLRAIRPLIDTKAIRRHCRSLYSPIGRPSILPEQLFLALVGGYLPGIGSDRKLVMELQCNMALKWFGGPGLDEQPWDASTFSQNRRRRFDQSGVLKKLFDQTVKRALQESLISRHLGADGTLVRANTSFKSFVPIEVAMDPEEYKKRLRSSDDEDHEGPQDPGNPTVSFRGQKRGNKTHRSMTDPDCRFVSKGSVGTGADPGSTVNAVMENRHRILLGLRAEIFRSSTSEEQEVLALLDRAKRAIPVQCEEPGGRQGILPPGVHRRGVSS
jgi:transposase